MVGGFTRVRIGVLVAVWLVVLPSAAQASHFFDDVGANNVHAAGIEWIADVGVTAGCGGASYCPNEAVTRAQMGTFLHRISGNAPGVAPSVNADRIDGRESAGIGSAATVFSWNTGAVSSTSAASLHAFSVSAPADGHVLVTVAGQVAHDNDATGPNSTTGSFTFGVCDSPSSFSACGATAMSYNSQDADNTSSLDSTLSIYKARTIEVTGGQDVTLWLNASVGASGQAVKVVDLYATVLFVPFELDA